MRKPTTKAKRHSTKPKRDARLVYDSDVRGWVKDPALLAGPPGQRAGNAVSRRLWVEADKLFRADNRLEFVTLRVSAAEASEMLKAGAWVDVLDPPFKSGQWRDQWAIMDRDTHFQSYKPYKTHADTRTALLVSVHPDREPPVGDFARALWTATLQAHEQKLLLMEYLDTLPELGSVLGLSPSDDGLGWVLERGRAREPAGRTRPTVIPNKPGDPHYGRYAAMAIWG